MGNRLVTPREDKTETGTACLLPQSTSDEWRKLYPWPVGKTSEGKEPSELFLWDSAELCQEKRGRVRLWEEQGESTEYSPFGNVVVWLGCWGAGSGNGGCRAW